MSADGCECAVVATHLELRELGTSEVYAFQACVTPCCRPGAYCTMTVPRICGCSPQK
jgi:hypothetical protein